MHESAPCIQCALGGQEKKLEPLELEFQVDVSCLQVVGTESVPSEEQCTLLASNTSPAPTECCVLCDVTFRCLMALEKQCEKKQDLSLTPVLLRSLSLLIRLSDSPGCWCQGAHSLSSFLCRGVSISVLRHEAEFYGITPLGTC